MEKRNVILVAVLGLITLGIYFLYWLVKTRRELVGTGAKIPTTWILATPIAVLLIAVVAGIALGAAGLAIAGALVAVAWIVGLVATLYYYYRYSMAAVQATGSDSTFGYLLLVLLIVFFPVAMLIAQDKYNKTQ